MKEKPAENVEQDQKKQLLTIFERLLPLIDSLADKVRLATLLGMVIVFWLVVWFYFLKQFSIGISAAVGIAALLPTLVLARFWWALEELKSLPDIAGQMMGDAKAEFHASVQNMRSGKIPKMGLLSAGKSLWSVGAMAIEAQGFVGSYISLATLVNPIMLILGLISFVCVFLLFWVGIVLAFFV